LQPYATPSSPVLALFSKPKPVSNLKQNVKSKGHTTTAVFSIGFRRAGTCFFLPITVTAAIARVYIIIIVIIISSSSSAITATVGM
jgi:hypothetical protein